MQMTWKQLEEALIASAEVTDPSDSNDWKRDLAGVIARRLGVANSKRLVNPLLELDREQYLDLERSVRRLSQGEPMAYVLGEADFGGMTFKVNRDTLIPRPDSEILLEATWQLVQRALDRSVPTLSILDLGTGSGCLAITLVQRLLEELAHRPQSTQIVVTASDLSAAALRVARLNALRLLGRESNEEGPVRWRFLCFDGPPEGESWDLIMTNPPYITTEEMGELDPSVSLYEPHLALDGGIAGDELMARVITDADHHLHPGGYILAEHGYRQREHMQRLEALHPKVRTVQQLKDWAGRDRVTLWTYGQEGSDEAFRPLSL